jgi:hypothetical protein
VIGALPALLLVVTSALPKRAAPLGPSLPSGSSDQVIFSGPGSLPNRVDIPEAAGGAESTAVFDCDSSICIPGAAVALTEPGRPTVVSDLLTVSGFRTPRPGPLRARYPRPRDEGLEGTEGARQPPSGSPPYRWLTASP